MGPFAVEADNRRNLGRVWKDENGKYYDDINTPIISPDSKWLVTKGSSKEGTAKMWSLSSGGSFEVEVSEEVVNNEEPVRMVDVNYSGDPKEILLTPDTLFYADVTPRPEISDADLETGSLVVTRTIIPGSPEAIEEGMILRVWGPIKDGVVTAEILVYELIE